MVCLVNSSKRNPRFKDLTGLSFIGLKAIKQVDNLGKSNDSFWLCECLSCNKETGPIPISNLKRNKSCGCLRDSLIKKGTRFKHGLKYDPFYERFVKIISRCNNPKDKAYKNYGGRGIEVWEHWDGLDLNCIEAFRNYILELYPDALDLFTKKYHIDRIRNDFGYFPGNLRIISNKDNSRNKRRSKKFNGVSVYDLYEECSNPAVSVKTFISRLDKGWNLYDALTTKPNKRIN